MTITEIWKQVKVFSLEELKELAKLLNDMLEPTESIIQPKTGAEIVAMLEAIELIEFLDPDIEDPVEWVKGF